MILVAGVDIETTGLEQAKGHRIVEFAAKLYDLETEKFLGKYVTRINPERPIDPDAQRVHGIRFEDLVGQPTIEMVAGQIVKILASAKVVVAHNGDGFDFPFIVNELIRIGVAAPKFRGFDTMLEGRWATPMGKLPNLGELAFACDVEYDITQAHAADYDVEVMMRSFFIGRRHGVFNLPEFPRMAVAA